MSKTRHDPPAGTDLSRTAAMLDAWDAKKDDRDVAWGRVKTDLDVLVLSDAEKHAKLAILEVFAEETKGFNSRETVMQGVSLKWLRRVVRNWRAARAWGTK